MGKRASDLRTLRKLEDEDVALRGVGLRPDAPSVGFGHHFAEGQAYSRAGMGRGLTSRVPDEFLEDLFPHVFRNTLPLVPHLQAHPITRGVGLDSGATASG